MHFMQVTHIIVLLLDLLLLKFLSLLLFEIHLLQNAEGDRGQDHGSSIHNRGQHSGR